MFRITSITKEQKEQKKQKEQKEQKEQEQRNIESVAHHPRCSLKMLDTLFVTYN